MILARPDAPDGSVTTLPYYSVSAFPLTSAVLCRNTAPLISFAFEHLRRSVPCHVVGKDIQVGLEKLVDKIGGLDLTEFRQRLLKHSATESLKLSRKGKKQQAANFEDKCAALLAISRNCNTTADVKAKIKLLFANGDGITLSTIHKAKGLDWETVFLLDWRLLPSPYAEQEWEKTQERNLQYVAVTRAKLNLYFINTNNWKLTNKQ